MRSGVTGISIWLRDTGSARESLRRRRGVADFGIETFGMLSWSGGA